ncbi:MAG: glycosyltransferase family 2 protein [Candidatus Fermentibacteraceae bacterium]|nr:glycosyltransferase family 2 protein [Candidatus Fermentibacteraceae bacterium]MBN2609536.1 glycosyltransferase family 2 protein [Candidatus Fermentibacteraceae bacterium]
MKSGVSFFCPAYNDEGNIRRTVESALATFRSLALDHEIVIVEDGSPDGTAEISDGLAEEYDTVRVVHHPVNRGYGGALRSGFESARNFELVTYTDGDGQYDFSEFGLLLDSWEDGVCVVGYRLERAEGFRRDFQNRVYGLILRMLFGLSVKDVNCSMKLFQRDHLDSIDIRSDSSFLDAEILIKLKRLGVGIVEVPVHHFPRLHGQASGMKFPVIMDTVRDMISYRLKRG